MIKKIIKVLTLCILLAIFAIVLKYVNVKYNIGLVCIFNKISGLYCPGCGMTRAVFSLMELDFYQAFRYNIFSILLLPILFIYGVSSSYAWIFNKKNLLEKKIPTVFWIIVIVLMLTYGIIRNLPMFSFLAPTLI